MVALVACGEESTPPPPSVQMNEVAEATPPPVVPLPVGEKPASEGAVVEAAEAAGQEPRVERTERGGTAGDPAVAPAASPCPDAPAAGARDVTVAWSDVRASQSCFFFSGPGALGRNDRLGGRARLDLRDGRAVLDFGGGVRFTGSAGERVTLARTSEHDFQGTWRVTERITGTWQAGVERHLDTPCTEAPRVAAAQYSYAECDTANPSSCPGPCTITATLTIR
jgi:hypothetical protein